MTFLAGSSSQFCKLVDVQWVPHENGRAECCSQFFQNFSQTMCYMICVLCCKKILLTFEPCEGDNSEEPTYAIDDRDYPTFTMTDSGISFTTSSYGAPLPIVFGSDKLTGNIFWASPVRTHLINDDTEMYQTLDFALGLCEGEINGILRMWLGDKLILDRTANTDENGIAQPNSTGWIAGASFDLTDADSPLRSLADAERLTKIDVYVGSELQLPDPTIIAAEGYDYTPAYRGTAYILFRNFIVASSSIPNIFVELLSNVENPFPRLYGDYPDPPVNFDRPNAGANSGVIVDLSYDAVHIASRNSADVGLGGRSGFSTFNYNNLDYNNEIELDQEIGAALNYRQARLLPQSGNIIIPRNVGNSGVVHIINPHAGILLNTFGPGGGIGDHNPLTGFSALSLGSIAFPALSNTGAFDQVDVFMGLGYLNGSIGFAEINAAGQLTYAQNLSNAMTRDNAYSAFTIIGTDFTHQTFLDGTPSAGRWVWIVNWGPGAQTSTVFNVGRMKVADAYGNSLIGSVTYSEPHVISVDDLRGGGIGHELITMFIDPADQCLVMFGRVTAETPFVFKYSPFTGEIVWKSSAPDYSLSYGNDRAYITNGKYCWVSTGIGRIYELNLEDGGVHLREAQIADYGLPLPSSFEQFYNGAENSITYQSNTSERFIVKLFLDKLTRSTVELGSIVENLLGRVGLLDTDMDITDVDDLTLQGYTIARPQTLRMCFSELAQAFKYDVVESNGKIRYLTRGKDSTIIVPKKWFGNITDQDGWISAKDENDIARIRKISLTYRDIDRDYKDNVQSIYLPNTSSRTFDNDSSIDVKVPIVLTSQTAKSLAEILLYAKLVYDTTYEGVLPERFSHLDPGDVVTVQPDGDVANNFQIRLKKTSLGANKAVKIEASREDPDIYNDVVSLFSGAGRYIEAAFKPVPPRIDVISLDIPFRSDAEAIDSENSYRVYFSFLNVRPAPPPSRAVGVIINGNESYTIQAPAAFPTWGYVVTPPISRSALYSTDNVSTLRVKMMSTSGAVIASADHADLLASNQVNLCWVGGELMQFTNVVDEGDNFYTFTGLHRAKFNTSTRYGTQTVGDRFILLGDATGILDQNAVGYIDVTADKEPSLLAQVFLRTSNPFQPRPLMNVKSMNLTPWSVATFKAVYDDETGDCVITWQRRTRHSGEWPDSGDETVPINEIEESYVIYIYTDDTQFDMTNASTYLRRVETSVNHFTYTDAMQVEDGFDRTTTDMMVAIYQQGSVSGFRYGTASKYLLPHL